MPSNGRCGSATKVKDGGWKRKCWACGTEWFPRTDPVVIMLVTDGGQLIRCPVNGIRLAGRSTQGVTVFNTAENEKVVSVERVSEPEGDGDDGEADETATEGEGGEA